jgi:hypothetical protein
LASVAASLFSADLKKGSSVLFATKAFAFKHVKLFVKEVIIFVSE